MTEPFNIGHRRTLLQIFAFVGHCLKAGEINHEEREGHEEFAGGERPVRFSHNRNLADIARPL